jgi:hypothetical protein
MNGASALEFTQEAIDRELLQQIAEDNTKSEKREYK